MQNKKILITGFSGFVGRHFLQYLIERDECFDVCGLDITNPGFGFSSDSNKVTVEFHKVNLLDKSALRTILQSFHPEYILHLASFSSVAFSWNYPEESFVNNTNIFLNLTSILKELDFSCRVLSVGSSEEYGNISKNQLPLCENNLLRPVSPYAVARVSQEMLSKVFVDGFHMDIVMTRSFNHIGCWQDERFVVPSFIRRILSIKDSGEKSGYIETGDISLVRDFVDVRDVVRAYYMLLMNGTSGEIYNICSGKGIALEEIIRLLSEMIGVEVKTKTNPQYVRPDDNAVIIGSYEKIEKEIGWKPTISLEESLRDMVAEMSK